MTKRKRNLNNSINNNKENINYGNNHNQNQNQNRNTSFKKLKYTDNNAYRNTFNNNNTNTNQFSNFNRTIINTNHHQQQKQPQPQRPQPQQPKPEQPKPPQQPPTQQQPENVDLIERSLKNILENQTQVKAQELDIIDKIFYNEHTDSDDSLRLVLNTSRTSYSSSDSDENETKLGAAEELLVGQSQTSTSDNTAKIEEIKELIKNSKTTLNLCVGGETSQLPIMPGISLKNFGCISLPVNVIEARELTKLMRHECGFYLNSNEIELKNELWTKQLGLFVDKISKDMDCRDKLEARLNKMVLYQQGDVVKRHKSESADKKLFAKLIVQLPSIYAGGELSVYEKSGVKRGFNFGLKSTRAAFSIHYAAFHSDLEWEMSEVLSGFRLILVYDLYGTRLNNDYLSQADLNDKLAACLGALSQPVALALENKYSDELFKANNVGALKGVDNVRFGMLKNASDLIKDGRNLEFYIISACLAEEEGARIEAMFDAKGRMYAADLTMSFGIFGDVIDFGKSEKVDVNDAKYWTDGRRYFLLFWPRVDEFKFDFEASFSLGVDRVLDALKPALKEDKEFEGQFRRLIKLMVERKRQQSLSLAEYQMGKLLKAVVYVKDLRLAQIVIGRLMSFYTEKCCDSIAILLQMFGWEAVGKANIENLVLPITNKNFSSNCCLAKSLHKTNQEKIVYPFYEDYIKPALNSKETFIKINENTESESRKDYCKVYVDLIEVTLLLDKLDRDALMKKICDMLIDTLKQKYFVNLLNYIVDRISNYRSNKHILRLFKHRANWLEEKVKENTDFTWEMPEATMTSLLIRDFLRTDKKEMTYTNFSSAEDAKAFAKTHSGFMNGYSVEMFVQGTKVTIKKTREYFDDKLKSLTNYKKELEQIKSLNLNF